MPPTAEASRIRLSAPMSENDGVYAFVRSAGRAGSRRSLPALKRPPGSTSRLYAAKGASSSSVRYSSLVMPMPCSPEITPSSERASAMIRATAAVASDSIP